MGWFVDDIHIESSNWYDLASTAATTYTRNGVSTGKYYYRVRTKFAAGPVGVPSGWSNVVSTQVYYTPPPAEKPDLVVAQIYVEMTHDIEDRISITALIANTGDTTAPASKTKFLLDGNSLLGMIDTPSLAAHGWVEVTVQWDTNGRTGSHTIDVTADNANDVDESSETNNGNTTTITLPQP